MVGEPFQDLGMLVGRIVVQHSMDYLSGGDGSFDGIEEFDEVLVTMLRHAASNDGAVENVEGGKQSGGAVALVVMRHCPAFARLERQSRLGAVEGLDLALLVDRNDDSMGWRVHIEADNVLDLGGEGGIVGLLEGPDTMRLQPMGLPDALDGTERNADGLGHQASGPVSDRPGRLGAG